MQILVYGYGNPGRQDDALGNAFAELTDEWCKTHNITNVTTDSNYLLNIEDADTISKYDMVIFVDASFEDIDSFKMTVLKPDENASFTTHAAHPAYILFLCQSIYGKMPQTYLFHIKGYSWDFLAEMTEQAKQNLQKAFQYFELAYKNDFKDW